MKKFLVSILAFLYITTSTGATMNMHFCMGKLNNWELGATTFKKCSKCGMEEKNNGCCRDEQTFLKNQPDQKITETAFQSIKIIAVALPPSFVGVVFNHFPQLTEKYPLSNAHPRTGDVAVYIRNCVFLI